jgi:hypothetical protein
MPTAARGAMPMTTNLEKGLIEISALIGIARVAGVIGYLIAAGIYESVKPYKNLLISPFGIFGQVLSIERLSTSIVRMWPCVFLYFDGINAVKKDAGKRHPYVECW